ncbi:PREDICTED: uncharacterized protein LOC108758473 [Trachymyrmex cornetzi]|uniref:uncharacterized protein LOC108758473 n=1 Tax=Trachymyrmex cornetzi TaxID=471704 RepID=UPI00084F5183|nr:PREDICTED: uncharacterized protein LOC108758473 [Trachymyrmex cornetzi]
MSDKVYSRQKGTKELHTTRLRSNVSKRRPKNRFEVEGDAEGVSASAKKLRTSEDLDVNYEFGKEWRLCNLKKSSKNLGEKGKLNAKLIDELTIYYGLAIRRNPTSLDDMKNEIWATLFHKLSTDENPQHEKCSKSWCNWKKAQEADTLDTFRHKSPLSEEVYEAIKPIYEDLSRDELLNRCLGGYTQNSNESFNATVWNLAPKSYSSGKTVLNVAADIATCVFNDGMTSIIHIMQLLEMEIGVQAYNFCIESDAKRIKHAEAQLSDAKTIRSPVKMGEEGGMRE